MAVGHGSRVPQPLRGALVRLMRGVPGVEGYTPVLDFEHPAETTIRWRGFSRSDIERLTGAPVSFEHTQYFRTFERFPRHAHFERYSALVDAMPCDRLNQSLLITSAPVRFPFWDGATDRYTRQLDARHRWRPGEPKRMLRVLLARHVPPSLWDQPKHSFDFPLQAFLASDYHALVRRHLDPDFWQTTGLLRAGAVWQLAEQFIAGDNSHLFRVWALVVLAAWLQSHGHGR
jgi:asparagine synthase (glutamine-hydrolysing)